MPKKSKTKRSLPWHTVEKQILKEMNWLREIMEHFIYLIVPNDDKLIEFRKK